MALLSEEEKKEIRRELRARARKSGAWKGAGLKKAPKMSMKGSSVLSQDKAKRKLQTDYITSVGKSAKAKTTRAKIVGASYKKAKVGTGTKSAAMRAAVSKTTGKKVPILGKTAAGSMKKVASKKGGGAARIAAKEWRAKHMAKAKTLKGTAKRDAMRNVQKAFKHKIGA